MGTTKGTRATTDRSQGKWLRWALPPRLTQGQPKGKAEIPVVTRECRRTNFDSRFPRAGQGRGRRYQRKGEQEVKKPQVSTGAGALCPPTPLGVPEVHPAPSGPHCQLGRVKGLPASSPTPCLLYSIRPCFYHQSHPQLGIVFALAPSLHSF